MGQFGRCINIDCAHYDEEIEVEVGGEMVCPHCGQPLEPITGPDPGLPPDGLGLWKKIAIGVGIAAVLGGGGYGCYALLGGSDKAPATKVSLIKKLPTVPTTTKGGDGITNHGGESTTPPAAAATLNVSPSSATVKVGSTTRLKPKMSDGSVASDVVWNTDNAVVASVSADGVVTGHKKGATQITAKMGEQTVVVKVTVSEDKGKVVPPTSPTGGINLGYGIYRGESRNGQPHGHGTITYTRSHRIVASKDFVANPGDKFEGEFRDGMVSGGMGYWYHNGDITAVKP